MAWESMTIYVVEFIRKGTRDHIHAYRQMENMEKARQEWTATEGNETQTSAVYVTDV